MLRVEEPTGMEICVMKRIRLVPFRNIYPPVLWQAHGAHCIKYTNDLNVNRLLAVTQPIRTRAFANFVWTVFFVTFANRHHVIVSQLFSSFVIDCTIRLPPGRLLDWRFGILRFVDRIHFPESRHLDVLAYADSGHKSSSCTGSVRAARETEEEDLIAGKIITGQEVIGFAHILVETGSEPACETLCLVKCSTFLQFSLEDLW